MSRQATLVAGPQGQRAAIRGVGKPKTTFFGRAIFTPKRQLRRDMTLVRRHAPLFWRHSIFCMIYANKAAKKPPGEPFTRGGRAARFLRVNSAYYSIPTSQLNSLVRLASPTLWGGHSANVANME